MSKYRHVDSMLHECKACNARFRIVRSALPDDCSNCARLAEVNKTLQDAVNVLGQVTVPDQLRKEAAKSVTELSKLIKEGTL